MKRQGDYVLNLPGISEYHSFNPSQLPPKPELLIDADIINLISKAHRELGELNGVASSIPDKNIFMSMYIRKEALLSSQIEGTQATLDDIFDPNIESNTNLEVMEVINYIKAVDFATNRLIDLPISNRFIKEVHKILLEGLRGDEKSPGEYRTSQNWIGPKDSNLRNATFVPPNVEDMNTSMGELVKFIHREEPLDVLVKIALIHYQFETIHPFLDGNGRVGRMLINLLLKEKHILSNDLLYISYFFKRNRAEYYDRLTYVRTRGNFEQWVSFFLNGIIESASDSIKCINLIIKLNAENLEKIEKSVGRAKSNVLKVYNLIQSNPIVDISHTSKIIDKTFKTTSNAISILVELNILKVVEKKERYRVFAYEEYLKILREGTKLTNKEADN